jgi:hypothetical protein
MSIISEPSEHIKVATLTFSGWFSKDVAVEYHLNSAIHLFHTCDLLPVDKLICFGGRSPDTKKFGSLVSFCGLPFTDIFLI